MIEPVMLAGGTRVLADVIPGSRTASVGFWFPFGSRFETESEYGFTHFVEHMLFKGTSKRSPRDIAREIDRVGGYLNAFTERDTLCFHCTLPAAHIGLAVEVLSDMVFSSIMPVHEFAREQRVIANEILASEDDPEDYSNDEYLKTVWPGSGMSRKIAGETGDVLKVTRDSLFKFYHRTFLPDALTVAVAGNVDVPSLLELLERKIISGTGKFVMPADTPPVFRKTGRFLKCRGQQVHVYAGSPIAPPFGSDEYNRLSVLSCAFGESMSSRIFQELRESKGLCYSAFSWVALTRDAGLFTVYGATSPSQYEAFFNALSEELVKLKSGGLDCYEIDEAKSHLYGASVVAFEDVETRMKRLARQWYYDGMVLEVEESLGELSLVSASGVNELLFERILDGGTFSVFAYGPKPRNVRKTVSIDF